MDPLVDSARIVQGAMILPFILMGLSHILQPDMWRSFFVHLHSLGEKGVLFRTFALELVPAIVLVTFHQVWHGLGVIITLYGIALTTKVCISLLAPSIGLRSLAMADQKGSKAFVGAGVFLIALGILCAWLYFGIAISLFCL